MLSKASIKSLTLSDVHVEDVYLHGMVNLEKITITKRVKTLPSGAFHNRKKLKKVFIEPEISLTKIPECCFLNCDQLELVTIPESTISIEERAFQGCSKVKQIEIPQNVRFVDPSAFNGWGPNQRIFHYRQIELSEKCKSVLIDLSDEDVVSQRIVTHETDLSKKKYIVTVKGGHVGRKYYIPLRFPIEATSKKEAARIARQIPRVKHDHKDAIIDVIAVDDETFFKQIELNNQDPYFKAKNKQQQNIFKDDIDKRKISEIE